MADPLTGEEKRALVEATLYASRASESIRDLVLGHRFPDCAEEGLIGVMKALGKLTHDASRALDADMAEKITG